MHQTFYIDVDEEITSIVERIRKAHLDEIVIVVPKGALLIQSVINLKLLKKEAENLGKEIIIVTQDKTGKALIEKTGIPFEQRIEDVEGEKWENVSEVKIEKAYMPKEEAVPIGKNFKKNLDKIGSSSFFESEESKSKEEKYVARDASLGEEELLRARNNKVGDISNESEKILNKELVVDLGKDVKRGKAGTSKRTVKGSMDMVKNKQEIFPEEKKYKQEMQQSFSEKRKPTFGERYRNVSQERKIKNEKFEQFLGSSENFSNHYNDEPKTRPAYKDKKYENLGQNISLPSRFWKFFLAFSLLIGFFSLSLLLYLFLPKAKVFIYLKTKSQSIDAEVKGDVKSGSIDAVNKIIPAKLISVADEVSGNFQTSGEKAAASRKARGTITIYNEYSSSSQPLVATTRFLSPDGKLFRLVSNLTIPGMTGSTPGAIEAEVVADEPGESFNIGPTTFSIPGFQGSGNEKYTKFYAKSFSDMAGGGSGEEVAKSVTDQDINSAKEKILAELNSSAKQKVKDQAGEGYLVLGDALNVNDINYRVSNSVGDITNEITLTLSAKINAIVFKEGDLREIIGELINKSSEGGLGISKETLEIDFGKSDSDITNGTILIRAHGNGKTDPGIDMENLKKGILGKNNEELGQYLGSYPAFSNVEVEYWPSFMGEKIPIYESRVEIVLDNN